VALEGIRVQRCVSDDDDIFLVLDDLSFRIREVVPAGELKADKNMIVTFPLVAVVLGTVERPGTDAGHGDRMYLAQEDTAGVELVTAQLGHQAAARAIE